MKLFNVTAAASLIAGIAAYTFPGGLIDGTYRVSRDDHGNEIHEGVDFEFSRTLKAKSTADESVTSSAKFKRDYYRKWCGCGLTMNHGDTDSAVGGLQAQFDEQGPNRQWYYYGSMYVIRGGVVAFFCPYSFAGMSREEYSFGLREITDSCGWYVPGTFRSYESGYSVDAGYMNWYEGLDFCNMAEAGRDGNR